MEDTIKISDIRPDNPIVVEAITSQGYAIVKHSFLEQCNRESAELARIKFDLKKRSEHGLAFLGGGRMTEEQIEKTVWLNRAFHTKHAIGALESVQNEKRSMAALCGMNYENDGSTNGSGENRQEQKNINLCEIDYKIDQARKELIRIYSEIETVINNVEDIELRAVLTYHYLSYMTWKLWPRR